MFFLVVLGILLGHIEIYIWIYHSFGNLFNLYYIRGYGGYSMSLFGIIIGIILTIFDIKGLIEDR